MPLNEKDVQGWTVDSLRNYLTTRGVKVVAASLLNLPEAPSVDEKCE